MATISVDAAWYKALVQAGLDGDMETFRAIDSRIRNQVGIVQHRVWIRWLEVGGSPPPSVHPHNWPETHKAEIVMDRAISRDDVLGLLDNMALDAIEVHITRDPDGNIGWYELDSFPF